MRKKKPATKGSRLKIVAKIALLHNQLANHSTGIVAGKATDVVVLTWLTGNRKRDGVGLAGAKHSRMSNHLICIIR